MDFTISGLSINVNVMSSISNVVNNSSVRNVLIILSSIALSLDDVPSHLLY